MAESRHEGLKLDLQLWGLLEREDSRLGCERGWGWMQNGTHLGYDRG